MSFDEEPEQHPTKEEWEKKMLCDALRAVIKKSFLVSLDPVDLANQLQLMVVDAKQALKQVDEEFY